MFVDIVKITIKAGNGGDGHISFHREKYVAQGGPDGGDGGRGGDIIFRVSPSLNTLIDFRFKKKFRALDGGKGDIKNCTGSDAPDLIIDVPQGTIIRDVETGKILADMFGREEQRTLLKGGAPGKGNARFATSTRQTPRFATPGQKREERTVQLELKTIADVGLCGMPNVGKSTILSVLTAARPKIANYHFTTLTPNLGVVKQDETSFVLADIPGLIEGAAAGAGLGHSFLRHIERTRMLVHVVDVSGSEGRDPLEDIRTINAELAQYSEKLSQLPQIVAANKIDITGAEENLEALKKELEPKGIAVFGVSAAANMGFEPLLRAVVKVLATLPPVERFAEEDLYEGIEYDPSSFNVEKDGNAFVVSGPMVSFIMGRTYPGNADSMRFFQQMLINSGIIAALREKGAKDGDSVVMGDWEFDFVD